MSEPLHTDRELVLDTNVLVHVLRSDMIGTDVRVRYGLDQREWQPMISAVTVGELHSLARQWNWVQPKIVALDALVRKLHVIDVAPDIGGLVTAYSQIDAESAAKGRPMGKNDLWIAATAKIFNAVLLTSDKDFDHLAPALISRDYIPAP